MSRQSIINIAEAENGIKELPANSNKTKYGEWYGLNGEKWCAIFVSWVYIHAGHPLEAIDRPKGFQSCKSGFNFWKRNNRIVKEPQSGDIVLYDWTGNGVCDHTGMFDSVRISMFPSPISVMALAPSCADQVTLKPWKSLIRLVSESLKIV